MPTYSYKCAKCGHVQDEFHAINAKPRIKCDVCGGRCKRLLGTGAGIIFKGSGFYETDYKKQSGKPGAKAESSEKSGDADKVKGNGGAASSKDGKQGKKEASGSSGSSDK